MLSTLVDPWFGDIPNGSSAHAATGHEGESESSKESIGKQSRLAESVASIISSVMALAARAQQMALEGFSHGGSARIE